MEFGMNNLHAGEASISMTLNITRADTGKTETVDVVLTPINGVPEDVDWHTRNGQLDMACGSSNPND